MRAPDPGQPDSDAGGSGTLALSEPMALRGQQFCLTGMFPELSAVRVDALIIGASLQPPSIGFFSAGFVGNTLGPERGEAAVEALLKRGQKRERGA